MKRQLTESSFRSIDNMNPDELKMYLLENGSIFWAERQRVDVDEDGDGIVDKTSIASGLRWMRNHPYEFDYNILTHDDLIRLSLDSWLKEIESKGALGTDRNPMPVETYNNLVRWDEWQGGYVEALGYVGIAASSLYGNSIYLSGSWYACGTPQNPVRVANYYKCSIENKWEGGYVDTWGYVSESTQILGCSVGAFADVDAGEGTLGTIMNIGTYFGYNMSVKGLREEFASFWDANSQSYRIDDKTLEEFFNRNFYHSVNQDLKSALKAHDGVVLRQVTNKSEEHGEIRCYGRDMMLVDYNPMRKKYECIEPLGPSMISILEKAIQSGKIELKQFIHARTS